METVRVPVIVPPVLTVAMISTLACETLFPLPSRSRTHGLGGDVDAALRRGTGLGRDRKLGRRPGRSGRSKGERGSAESSRRCCQVLLGPAVAPNVQLPTVAIPLAFVVAFPPVMLPPPVATAKGDTATRNRIAQPPSSDQYCRINRDRRAHRCALRITCARGDRGGGTGRQGDVPGRHRCESGRKEGEACNRQPIR